MSDLSLPDRIVRAVCELQDKPDPEHPDTICITVDDLKAVIENHAFKELTEIKLLACTMGAPGAISVVQGLIKIMMLCNKAGMTKKLDELQATIQ